MTFYRGEVGGGSRVGTGRDKAVLVKVKLGLTGTTEYTATEDMCIQRTKPSTRRTSHHPQLVIAILRDVAHPGQCVVSTFFDNLQVVYLKKTQCYLY